MLIGSMFSGIGALDLGLERAGVGETVWMAENNKFCRSVLVRHWPRAHIFGDVRSIGADVPRVDVLAAGFPCQDISVAGKGKGLDGERSGLFYEVVRVLRILGGKGGGQFVVLENVPAITSRGLGRVLGELAFLGYDARWGTLSAEDVGAPQKRNRWWLLGRKRKRGPFPDPDRYEIRHDQQWDRHGDGQALPDGGQTVAAHHRRKVADPDGAGRIAEWGQKRAQLEGERGSEPNRCSKAGPERVQDRTAFPPRPGQVQLWGSVPDDLKPGICRVANGAPSRVGHREQLRALGNAVVPQCAEVIGRHLIEWAIDEEERGQRAHPLQLAGK